MSRSIVAINLEVQCTDGISHEGVALAVDGTKRIYLNADGSELHNVESIIKCALVVPPIVFAAFMQRCKEAE